MATDEIERLHYYQRQYLGADDLEAQQAYHRDMRRRHNIGLHTWGIVTGLDLIEKPNEIDPTAIDVFVAPGMAVDGFGREIVVFQPIQIDIAMLDSFTNLAHRSVWIEYAQINTAFPKPGYQVCERNDYSRVEEIFRIVVEPTPPTHDPVNLSGVGVQPPAIPLDESVPEQEFPDDSIAPQWLVPLGYVHWDGVAKKLVPAAPAKKAAGRLYVGAIAEQLIGPAGKLILRDRGAPDPLPNDPKQDGYKGVAAEVEGTLQVDRTLIAKQDIEIDGGRLLFDNAAGGDDGVPLWMSRLAGPKTPGTADLRIHIGAAKIGDATAKDTRLTIGNFEADGKTESAIFDVKGDNTVDIPTGALQFGTLPRQMINLSTSFNGHSYNGIGAQPNTTYFRSNMQFAWFQNGSHSDTDADPGGGALMLTLNEGGLFFGNLQQQMLNLFNDQYGIGVQKEALYFRSDSDFCWFRGGGHNSGQDDPGGGTRGMLLDGDYNLSVKGGLACGGALPNLHTLNVNGDALIDGDLEISGNIKVKGNEDLIRVFTQDYKAPLNLLNVDKNTPTDWTVDHKNQFSEIYARFVVLQGFNINDKVGPATGHPDPEFTAIPQNVFVQATGGDTESTKGISYCMSSSAGNPGLPNPIGAVMFVVVVIGKGVQK